MATKLFPTDPQTTISIRRLSPNITTLSLPFSRFGRMKIGARATLIRLPASGHVAVFSPVPLTQEVKDTVAAMGRLRYIAAVDMEHHIHLPTWADEYPDAKVIAPEGLEDKRKKQGDRPVRFDHLARVGGRAETRLTGQDQGPDAGGTPEKPHEEGGRFGVDAEFDAEFDTCYVPGHANKELVFHFKRERTLVEGDLMFNLPAVEQYGKGGGNPHEGALTRLANALMGTSGGPARWQQRLIWYGTSSGDRPGFSRSIQAIDAWDFDRIIPCHGDVIETGGKGVFRNIFGWHLNMQLPQKKDKGA